MENTQLVLPSSINLINSLPENIQVQNALVSVAMGRQVTSLEIQRSEILKRQTELQKKLPVLAKALEKAAKKQVETLEDDPTVAEAMAKVLSGLKTFGYRSTFGIEYKGLEVTGKGRVEINTEVSVKVYNKKTSDSYYGRNTSDIDLTYVIDANEEVTSAYDAQEEVTDEITKLNEALYSVEEKRSNIGLKNMQVQGAVAEVQLKDMGKTDQLNNVLSIISADDDRVKKITEGK